jgi:hypothetical protein
MDLIAGISSVQQSYNFYYGKCIQNSCQHVFLNVASLSDYFCAQNAAMSPKTWKWTEN